MVSFRYFLTSLIAVFLALAVGVVLGAGPLKEAIGDTLTGRVDQLNAQVGELQGSLETSTSALAGAEEFIAAAATQLVPGTLTERRVAVVSIGENPDGIAQASAAVVAAGGQVTTVARVLPAWTDPAQSSFRQQLASTLPAYLNPVPAVGTSSDAVLAQALAQALVKTDAADPNVLRVNNDLVLELIVNAELVAIDSGGTAPVDAIIVLAPLTDLEAVEGGADPTAMLKSFAAQFATVAPTAVVAAEQSALIDALVADPAATSTVTTLTGASGGDGDITIPLALGSTIAGTVGHYGPNLAPVPPRVMLDPPARAPNP